MVPEEAAGALYDEALALVGEAKHLAAPIHLVLRESIGELVRSMSRMLALAVKDRCQNPDPCVTPAERADCPSLLSATVAPGLPLLQSHARW